MFTVVDVIDGDTFVVSPGWQWNGQSGDRVRPTGYDTPERGRWGWEAAREKLRRLLLGKQVELRKAHTIDRGRLVCDVYLNGHPLAAYFPEYAEGQRP